MDDWNIYKFENGHYSDATEREVAQPTFNPVITFKRYWSGGESVVPIVYENKVLYFVYTDASTQEETKERVELRGNGYEQLLIEAESALMKYFQR